VQNGICAIQVACDSSMLKCSRPDVIIFKLKYGYPSLMTKIVRAFIPHVIIVLLPRVVQTVMVHTRHLVSTALILYGIMKILQANVRSLNTTKDMLQLAQVTHQAHILLLQEVWNIRNNSHLRDFMPPVMKVRDNSCGGGVAIYAHVSAKLVPLTCYDVDSLEAVWAKVMVGNISCVIGSVYIPPGAADKIKLLAKQLAHVCSEHEEVLVGMDANARNMLWDEQVSHGVSRKMGDELLAALLDSGMEVLNDGTHTYHK